MKALLWYKVLCFFKGINLSYEPLNKIITLKKKNYTLIFRETITKKAINYFDKVFKYSISDTVDLRNKYFDISFFGSNLKTDFEQVKEIDEAILKYNIYYQLKQGDIVFDLGAYHGVYSIYAALKVGDTGKVYCFEPDPVNFEILKANIERNKINNAILINTAISNEEENKRFFIKGHGSRIVGKDFKTNTKGALTTTNTIALSKYLSQNQINHSDFVKVDIEGSEIEFMNDYLKNVYPLKITPHMAIASYHYRKDLGTNTSQAIAKEFKKNGIKVNIGNKKHECVFV